MPQWVLDIVITAGSVATSLAAIRLALVSPLRRLAAVVDEFRALLDIPDAVRDLTSTLVRYVSETEPRIVRLEEAVAFIARVLRIRIGLARNGNDETHGL